jgi:hypothetical protein
LTLALPHAEVEWLEGGHAQLADDIAACLRTSRAF